MCVFLYALTRKSLVGHFINVGTTSVCVCVYKVNVRSAQHIGLVISSQLKQRSIKPNEAAELRFGTEAQAPARRHTNTLFCVFFCFSLNTRSLAMRVDKCVPTILLRQKKQKDTSHSSPGAMFFGFFFFFKVLFSSALGGWGEVSSPSPQISHALQS